MKLEVDEIIAHKAGEYLNRHRPTTKMELADALIAATAFVAGAEVITRNLKHYPIGDVQIVAPYERGN